MGALEELKARVEGHTEGPWHIETDSEQDYEQGIPFSEWPCVLVGPEATDPGEWAKTHGETRRIQEVAELSMADAELIAAAPKMLAALEAVEAKLTRWEAEATGKSSQDYTLRAVVTMTRSAIEEALQ